MYNISYLTNKADSIYKKYKTRDPFEIAFEMGIHVSFRDDFSKLYGMYAYVLKNRYIYINSHISKEKQKIVCAHELGHDILHRELAKGQALQEFQLYDMQLRTEYEANVFAANLLIDEEDMLDCIQFGYDSMQIASILKCDVNLIAIKTDCLVHNGYKLNRQSYDSTFLKNRD